MDTCTYHTTPYIPDSPALARTAQTLARTLARTARTARTLAQTGHTARTLALTLAPTVGRPGLPRLQMPSPDARAGSQTPGLGPTAICWEKEAKTNLIMCPKNLIMCSPKVIRKNWFGHEASLFTLSTKPKLFSFFFRLYNCRRGEIQAPIFQRISKQISS